MDDLTDAVPRTHPDTGVQRLEGQLMAVGPDDLMHVFEDDTGQVSEVAERIVELADGRRTVGQIVERLCDEFEVDRQVCADDTNKFIRLLVERKILVLG